MIYTAQATAAPYSALVTSDAPAALQSEQAQPIPVAKQPAGLDGGHQEDKVTLSQSGRLLSAENSTATDGKNGAVERREPQDSGKPKQETQEFSAEEQHAVQQLKQRDREVRAHEQAHLASAGQYAAGGPSYSYQTGPDGRRYAIGGEVPIDVSTEKSPEETIQKMRVVKRAALAPSNPSSADRQIAAAASRNETEAIQEMNSVQHAEQGTEPEDSSPESSSRGVPAGERPEYSGRRQDFQALYA